jgi:DNA-binding transcriptional ArsR family regulator
MSDVFKALSHAGRRRILVALRDRAMTPTQLSDELGIKLPNLSAQLNVLKQAGIVHGERNGTSITYRLNLSVVESALASLMTQLHVGEAEQEGQHG